LNADDAPEVSAYLENLCKEVALSRLPTFLWNPLSTSSGGLAFGRWGRYYVALGGGLVTRFYTDRPAFRAILLHELAHLKNADIDKTYFAVAVWQSFVLVNALPFIISVLANSIIPFNEMLTFGALGLLVYLIRNSILRARELYADARASIWDGPLGALPRVLGALPKPQARGWPAALQVHPSSLERRQMLDNTDGLFRMSFWIAVATGINLFIVMANIQLWLDMFGLPLQLEAVLLGILLAPLAAGIVGLGAWRGGFMRAARGNASAGVWRLALGMGLGWMIGKPLFLGPSMFTQMSGQPEPFLIILLSAFFDFMWSGLLVAVMFSLLTWMTAVADSWFDASVLRPRRLTYLFMLVFVSGIFAAALTWLLIPYRMHELASGDGFQLVVTGFLLPFLSMQVNLINPLAFVALASLWAAPLATWFWQKRMQSGALSEGAFVDPQTDKLLLPPALPALEPKSSIRMGLITGFLFAAINFFIFTIMKVTGLYDVMSNNEQYKSIFLLAVVALAVLMQLAVSTITAGRIRRLGWVHGLFAAFVAGCVMTMGFLGINLLFRLLAGKIAAVSWGGGLEPIFVWTMFSWIVTQGALFSLLPAIAVFTFFGRRRLLSNMQIAEPA
jgi:hypothetical protein